MTRDEDEIKAQEAEEKARKRKPPKRAAKATPKRDPWVTLLQLISAYAEAAVTESWKGGGDPADIEIHELRLRIARIELSNHIAAMKEEFT